MDTYVSIGLSSNNLYFKQYLTFYVTFFTSINFINTFALINDNSYCYLSYISIGHLKSNQIFMI